MYDVPLSHSDTVLSAILHPGNPTRRDLLAHASVRLESEHFRNEGDRLLFQVLTRYFDRTGEVLPVNVYVKALESKGEEAAKILAYTQRYRTLSEIPTPVAEGRWSVGELREEQAKRLTGIAITEGMEILERGTEIDRLGFLKGHQEARKFLEGKLSEIDRLGAIETTPEGNIFTEADSILADYDKRKRGELGRGIHTGIKAIDDATGGFQRGELILVAGVAGTGKSQVLTQTCWDAAVNQGQNVFLATSETVRDQVIRRILARHSKKFKPEGLNATDIKRGTLTTADEKILRDVVDDWTNNPAYGKLHILQVPRGATLTYVESRLREFGRENPCGLVGIDYLALLKPESSRHSEREELNEIIKNAKLVATSFNDGEGVPLISPWQINREGQKANLVQGFYTMAALSDTSEAEKSADQILTLMRGQDDRTSMKVQFLKMRDDNVPSILDVAIDFRCSYIGTMQAPSSLAPGGVSFSVDDTLMDLI